MTAQAIGRYVVLGLLGEGTFGQVFAARDRALGRQVAVKVLRPQFTGDASFMARFQAEAASLAALNHLNVTLIYDILESGDQHGIVMELVQGHTLEHVLLQRQKLELPEALAVTAQVVAGLSYVHDKGVVHRDIKPSNMMLTVEGVLKIMDFGIARVQGAKRLTREGSVMGTLNYASPEQIKSGEVEQRSDLYSLACMVYEMICGSPPFDGRTEYDLMQAHIAELPEPLSKRLPELPLVVDRAVMRALSKNPDDRFATIREFGQAIGIEAIQSRAVKIVHNIVERSGAIPTLLEGAAPAVGPAGQPAMGELPPSLRSRAEAAPPDRGRANDVAAQPAVVSPPRSVQQGRLSAGAMREAAPLLTMGGAAVVALATLGFILWDGMRPQGASTQTAEVTDSPSKSDPPKKDGPANSSTSSRDPSQKAAVDKPPPPPPPPPETPAYQGRIVDWIGGSAILVPDDSGRGVRIMKLHGVRDVLGTQQQANQVRRDLNGYLDANGRDVSCYKRGAGRDQKEPEYQCFVGKQDIARWALGQRLAQVAPDAPQEYRAASQ